MWFLSPCVALAGSVVIDAAVPIDVFVNTEALARLYVPGIVTLPLDDGPRKLQIWVDGNPHEVSIDVPVVGVTTVMVGKNGITTAAPNAPDVPVGPVEFRVAGRAEVMFTLDDQRHHLAPGEVLKVELTEGNHMISVRDASGTQIWAKGLLTVKEPRGVIVQLSEGRMPEVAGTGGRFVPDGN